MKFNLDVKDTYTLLSERFSNWYEIGIKNLPNLVVAIIVFFIFFLFSKVARKAVKKVFPRFSENRSLINLTETLLALLVLTVGLFISLEILNLEKTVTSILAGAGVVGLALGFAFQEIAANFVSGIFIAFQKPYEIGDIIEIDSFFGEVTQINLRTTSITTFQGLEILIPNKSMFTMPLTNFTTTPRRRLDIKVGVSYGDDLEKVTQVTKDALEDLENRISSEQIEVFFEEYGASSINLVAQIWINYPGNNAYLKSRHKAIIKIKKAFDQNGISIPFPIRTLDLPKSFTEKFSNQ